ncbi:MAG: aspartate aminotransferase family protein [Alphaproteobacteria bacterium]|nr:aspartate aminotransferase family protein [Alphaproteobacteria bacterium]
MNDVSRSFRGNSNAARDIAHHLHPYTNHKKHEGQGPLTIVRGRGVYVMDDDGKEYIEGMAGLWSAALGFSNERLARVAYEQMKQLPFYHAFNHRSHEPAIDLAERLKAMAPVPMSKVFFANSGSEANDTVVKMVWYLNNALGRPQKKKIVSRIKGYHGVTVASASLTGLPNNHRSFDLPIPGVLHTSCPHYYRFGAAGETEEQFATRCAEELEALVLKEGPDTVAAMICEPVMAAGGVIVPPRGYYEKIQAVCRKYDMLFIADEVICGFGRTGNVWGCQTMGIQPDILTCAKALSASFLPISAVMVNERVYQALMSESDKIGVWGHGFTYSGHPVAAAVALEAQKIYEETDLFGHAKRLSPVFQKHIQSFADHPLVGETMGVGLVGAIELVADRKTRVAFDPVAVGVGNRVMRLAMESGLIIRNIGDRIAVCPPLVITETELGDLFGRLRRALDAATDELKAEGHFKG